MLPSSSPAVGLDLRRAALIALASFALLLGWTARADAYVVTKSAEDTAYFVGGACGSTDTVEVDVPSGATNLGPASPVVGTPLHDDDGATVARIIKVQIDGNRDDGYTATFTASGSDETCSEGAEGWETEVLDFKVDYETDEPVRFSGDDDTSRVRPRTIYFGAHERIVRLHWRGWGRSVTVGRGTYPLNNCEPSCAEGHFTRKRVNVRLSRIRYCEASESYEYMTLTYRLLGRIPRGALRRGRVSFDSTC